MPLNSEPTPTFNIHRPDANTVHVPRSTEISVNPNIPPAHLILNEVGKPTAVEILDERFDLDFKTEATTVSNFLDLKFAYKQKPIIHPLAADPNDYDDRTILNIENPFKHPLADRLYNSARHIFQTRASDQIKESFQEDSKLMSEKDAKAFTEKLNSQIGRDATIETNAYLDDLRATFGNSPVTIEKFTIKSHPPIRYTKITLGQLQFEAPEDRFLVNETAISTIFFAQTTLGESPSAKPIVLFQFGLPETERRPNRFANLLMETSNCGGKYDLLTNTAFIDSSPDVTIASAPHDADVLTEYVTKSEWLRRITAHEVAHETDSQIKPETSPQAESFAVSLQYDFNYGKIKEELLSDTQYRRDATSERILDIFSSSPPHLTDTEKYFLSGSFLSWIYQHHGPDAFTSFRKNLTNPQFYSQEKPTHKVFAALAFAFQPKNDTPITKESYTKARDLLDQFVSNINSPITN